MRSARIILVASVLALCAGASPPPRFKGAAFDRLVHTFDVVRNYYVPQPDMAPLATAATEAVRRKAGIDGEAWSRCPTLEPPELPRSTPADLAETFRALNCAMLNSSNFPGQNDILIDSAITEMISGLNDQTKFWTPEDIKNRNGQNWGSVGLDLVENIEGPVVVRVPIGFPAAQAGIKIGDVIVAIDGISTSGLPLSDVIFKLRGPDGSSVNLSVRRGAEQPRSITLGRKVIRFEEAAFGIERRGSVIFIDIKYFTADISEKIKTFMKNQTLPITGIVMDLRYNSGGILESVIEASDLFLDKAVIVSSRGRAEQDSYTYQARKGQLAPGLPIFLLVSGRTASGGEIFASALQDNKRALVLGDITSGVGAVQTRFPIQGGYYFELTTSYQYRANGQKISDTPVTPDCAGPSDPAALLDYAVSLAAKGATSCRL